MQRLSILALVCLAGGGCGSDEPVSNPRCSSSAECAPGQCVEGRCVSPNPAADAGPGLDAGNGLDQFGDAGMMDAATGDADAPDGSLLDGGSDPEAGTDGSIAVDATTDAEVDASYDAEVDATPDAVVDATTDGGLSACTDFPTALACDDFEYPSFPWESRETRGGIEIIRGDAAHGLGFARAEAEPSGEALFFHDFAAAPYQDVYFRAYMRTNVEAIENVAVVVQLESVPFDDKISLDFAHGAEAHLVGPAPGAIFGASETFPSEEWACVEFDVTFRGTVGTMVLRVDGTEIGSTLVSSTSALSRIGFGVISNGGNDVPFSVDFDDVVVDRNPIGCLVR